MSSEKFVCPYRALAWGLWLLSAFLGSCLSEIELEVPDNEGDQIAIRGVVVAADTSETSYVEVKVSYVSSFEDTDGPDFLEGVSVSLMDDLGHEVDIPQREAGGFYLSFREAQNGLLPEPGRSYRIRVVTASSTYLSDWDLLHPVPKPTGVTQSSEIRNVLNDVGNLVEREFLSFQLSTPITSEGEGAYLKWSFSGTYQFTESKDLPRICFISEPLNLEKVVVFNGAAAREEELTDFLLLEKLYDYRFFEGYYLTVRQQSLSREAFQYWERIGEVVNRTGNLFEAPAGKVRGNIHHTENKDEEVFGYFYAVEEALIHYRAGPGQTTLYYLCSPQVSPMHDACLDCTAHPRASLQQPAYWK
ncbi:DUF4249 family protein [Flavilitoribacter nigricans]|uniref:DUF4249 domain-containing protein n=1 Tax=Flavilitoribacter nigricans (strain ATCC 23147 / DSM 23189 / NBRC 102662 / NCIMB 1420 / SS-2) TaxID=1122177 RepID=A0A2D0NHR5_FLAN2|nr:DUF4249 family protein [Flavilitoribacter nigricans]PHN07920.1 hypothetical protein CRP01_03970 [Flavilitoribacter nigricans DSM 23189 = NBRC 102662]